MRRNILIAMNTSSYEGFLQGLATVRERVRLLRDPQGEDSRGHCRKEPQLEG